MDGFAAARIVSPNGAHLGIFASGYDAERGTPPEGSRDYLVNHSQSAILYGPEGTPIAIVPHDQGPAAVVAELERWVA